MWIKKTDVGELWIETFFTVDKNLMWIKKNLWIKPKIGHLWIRLLVD